MKPFPLSLCHGYLKRHLYILSLVCFSLPLKWVTGESMMPPPIDTIPVVVHVIHTGTPVGSPDNPSDSLILSMLQQANDAFQLNGPMYGGADIGLHFQLAGISPFCTNTNGIVRVDGSVVPEYSTGGITFDTINFPGSAHEVFVKALSRWPNTDYLNIWIVHTIDGQPFWPGGYAYFPEYNSALTDGLVLRASVVDGTNKTFIHELGHYFYLYHTFGDAWGACIPESICMTDGDLICDTENCMYMTDCTSTTNPCTNEAWMIADTALGYTVLHNYMGYTDCQWMFSEGQRERIRYALNTFRPGLLSSGALDLFPTPTPPTACMPTAVNGLSPYYGIERVEINDLVVYSNTSQADGAFYVDRTCHQRIRVAAGDSIILRITSSYENYSQVRVFLDLDQNGLFSDPGELILDQSGGIVMDTFIVPFNAPELCAPLRMRIVSDLPGAPPPDPCLLTGTAMDGVGQIEDYALIITPRQIESTDTGDWDDPSVWSCNCIPGVNDAVYINPGDTISILPPMGLIQCAYVHAHPGGHLELQGEFLVSGGCPE